MTFFDIFKSFVEEELDQTIIPNVIGHPVDEEERKYFDAFALKIFLKAHVTFDGALDLNAEDLAFGSTEHILIGNAVMTIKPAAMAKLGISGALFNSVSAVNIPVLAPDITSAAMMIDTSAASQPNPRHKALASASRVSFCIPAKGASALR